jgi:hypothetical protein
MVGITLSPEQVRGAPPDVRRWLEQQISGSLGLFAAPQPAETHSRHLVGCQVEQARAIFSLIQRLLPVLGVFFELARDPVVVTPQGVRVLHLDDMMRHCRLQAPEQVVGCLETINEAFRRVSGDSEALITGVDGAGHCLVADVTARSIRVIWQDIIEAHDRSGSEPAQPNAVPVAAAGGFQAPYAIAVPATDVKTTLNNA